MIAAVAVPPNCRCIRSFPALTPIITVSARVDLLMGPCYGSFRFQVSLHGRDETGSR